VCCWRPRLCSRPPPRPAFAQAQSQADPSVQLEEIIVTSTKRAERLQDVPVSVTALTRT
jgi:iron complex outermembrane receptor protein